MAKSTDRQIVLDDEKKRVLDLSATRLPVPEIGIYDGQVRWYKANLEWARIIEGHVSWLASVAAWQDAEDEGYQAIQEILTFLEGVEPEMTIDYEAMKEAVCEGVVCAGNKLAAQLLSGQSDNVAPGGGIEINDKGEIVVKPSTGVPDDPTTTDDNAERSGGATAIRIGINSIWSQLATWYTAVPQVPIATAQERLKKLYVLNSVQADSLVSQYYSDRQQAQPFVTSFAATLDGYLYCKGTNIEVIYEWIYDLHTANQQAQAAFMPAALTDNQIAIWMKQGAAVPSFDYVAYSCVPIDPESFVLDAAYLQTSAYKNGAQTGKVNHRILIKVSGKVNHPSDGSYQDFFYRVQANGTKDFVGIATSFGTLQFNDNLSNPPQSKVPWKASGEYSYTMETTSAQAYRFRRAISAANMAAGATGFQITLTDLGEVIS
jgi:hypothetical protein